MRVCSAENLDLNRSLESTMQRIAEPELMDSEEQAMAYSSADFSKPHDFFVQLFGDLFRGLSIEGTVLDLGCGPADVTIRFARAYPACRIHGIDAGPNMLRLGRECAMREGLNDRIELIQGHLPEDAPPFSRYDGIISNSLLHHLADPLVLWQCIRRYAQPGAPVLVMDLLRPESEAELDSLVAGYAAGEPEILQQDFRNSLMAAYRAAEVERQLEMSGLLDFSVGQVSDRHVAVWGLGPG